MYLFIYYVVAIYNISNILVFIQSLLFISKLNLYVFHEGFKGTFIKAELQSHQMKWRLAQNILKSINLFFPIKAKK